jgi:hypothetical protein
MPNGANKLPEGQLPDREGDALEFVSEFLFSVRSRCGIWSLQILPLCDDFGPHGFAPSEDSVNAGRIARTI